MREIGVIGNEPDATRFVDYLLTLGVTSKLESRDAGWAVWVREEEQVARASEELGQYLQEPRAPRYVDSTHEARELRRQSSKAAADAHRKFVDVRERWERQQSPRARPLTMTLILASVVISIVTSFGAQNPELLQYLYISDTWTPPPYGWLPPEVLHGEVWRLVTPIFIHLGVLHLVFNMWWLYDLGGILEMRRGPWRLALMVLLIAAVSNVVQYHARGPAFGGMSGVVYGLLGYAWMKSRYEPQSGIFLHPSTVTWMMIWFFVCAVGWVGNVANWAHGGGLAMGVVLGGAVPLWKNLTRR